MSQFYILSLNDVPMEILEEISQALFDNGATGVQEDVPFEQIGEFYEVKELSRDATQLKAYFSKPTELEQLKNQYPQLKFELASELDRDWMEEWKKGFEAFELIDGIYVVPSWLEAPKEAREVLRIDPGMAFGTGTHETTQLASELLSQVGPKKSLIDVGTGTGILGFLAEHLGFEDVVGLEIDDEARRTARENVELNQSNMKILDDLAEKHEAQYNVVVANIIDGVLSRLQESLKGMVLPGGHLLLTGIIEERETIFKEQFSFEGFEVVERRQKSEWVGYLLRKKK